MPFLVVFLCDRGEMFILVPRPCERAHILTFFYGWLSASPVACCWVRRKILFLGYIVGALAITWSTATATKIFVAVLSMQVCSALSCVSPWCATVLGLVAALLSEACSGYFRRPLTRILVASFACC